MILPIEFESFMVENVTAHIVKLQTLRRLRRVYHTVKISGDGINPAGIFAKI